MESKNVVIVLVNPDCPTPLIPSFNQVIYEGVFYPLINEGIKFNPTPSLDPYHKIKAKVLGEVVETTGLMPNPMVKQKAFKLIKVIEEV